MTEYAPMHPAGPSLVLANCGEDGTAAYAVFHPEGLLGTIENYRLGQLDESDGLPQGTNPPRQILGEITAEELAAHNTTVDCWVQYYEDVYDLSYYSHPSPPGQSVIYMSCGQDGTRNYSAVHPRDLLARQVETFKIGRITTSGCWKPGLAPNLASLFFFACFGAF